MAAIVFLLLLTFAMATGFQPPVLRALFSWATGSASSIWKWNWTRLHVLIASGASTLFFCVNRSEVLSLGLSWSAALALHFAGLLGQTARVRSWRTDVIRAATTQVTAYSILWVPLLTITVAHPASVLCNLILSPLIGLVLFPASLITLLFNAAAPFVDILWSLCLSLISEIASTLPSTATTSTIPVSAVVIYIGALTLASMSIEGRQR